MTNILIIDDDKNKREDIKKAINENFMEIHYDEVTSRNEALTFLSENKGNIDLVVLDWIFPLMKDTMPEKDMGKQVLEKMQRLNLDIDTIICSREVVDLEKDYDNVLGIIEYSPYESMSGGFKLLLSNRRDLVRFPTHLNELDESDFKSIQKTKILNYKRKHSTEE